MVYKAQKSKGGELAIGLDTVYYYAAMLERPADARAAWARTTARVPMSQVTPAERPWRNIARMAVRMHDPAMARLALDGFEHDQAAREPDVEGGRAFFAAHVALAEQKWDQGIQLLHEADKRYSIFDKYALAALAQAHDLAGHADSAIVYFEKFTTFKDPNMNDGRAVPRGVVQAPRRALRSQGRPGEGDRELREVRGSLEECRAGAAAEGGRSPGEAD